MHAPHTRLARLTCGVAGIAVVAACAGGSDPGPRTPAPALPQGDEKVTLDPAEFSTTIDNPWFPLVPGTRLSYREVDGDGEVTTVDVTVTDTTRKIANGITARVVRDTARVGGSIIEDTFDWYAQDSRGAVWYLGEDTATFENGKKVSTKGSFEAGVDGAQAGVAMPAEAAAGMRYRQEFYRGAAEDNGEVLSPREMVDVGREHYGAVLLTKDTSSIEPDLVEYKFYARGVGTVLTLDIAGGTGREELVSVTQVPPGTGTGPLGSPE